MLDNLKIRMALDKILRGNSRYQTEAYLFVLAALSKTLSSLPEKRHISGREFCLGISKYAQELFGPLAMEVLNRWGIKETVDFGNIVFSLVEVGLMGKTEQDSIADFIDVYNFEDEFTKNYNYIG
jgi:uncharacterized repeat protein (TIGR04138 family)